MFVLCSVVSFFQAILIALKLVTGVNVPWVIVLLPFIVINVFLVCGLLKAFFSKDIDAKKYRSNMLEKYNK